MDAAGARERIADGRAALARAVAAVERSESGIRANGVTGWRGIARDLFDARLADARRQLVALDAMLRASDADLALVETAVRHG